MAFTDDLYRDGDPIADTKAPDRPDRGALGAGASSSAKLVNPANRRKLTIIVVGTGLAGGSAAATLGGGGLPRQVVLLPGQPAARALDRRAGRHQRRQELPQRRRLASYRLFYDTVKGGDFRSRESNVYRLAEVSA